MKIFRKDDLQTIIWKYGEHAQWIMTIEEMSELTKEIAKIFRDKYDKESMLDEMADVMVMLHQCMILTGISPDELEERMDYKVDRTLERLAKNEL